MRTFPFIVLFLLLCLPTVSVAAAYSLHKVGERTYAAIAGAGETGTGNALIVVTSKYVVVAGGHFIDGAFAELARQIAGITPLPLRYLVITHQENHPRRNDREFPPGVEIITSEQIWNAMKAESPLYVSSAAVFDKGLTFYCGDRSLLMTVMEGGRPTSSVVVYLPDTAVLFTSDLTWDDTSGFTAGGNARQWVLNLQTLEKLFATKVIPGKGAVTDSEGLRRYRLHLQEFLSEVLTHVERGETSTETIRGFRLSPEKMPPGFSRHLPENILWAWRELHSP